MGGNGAFRISEGTRKIATKCPSNCECMTNHKWDTCSIERDLPKTFLVIMDNSQEQVKKVNSL